MERVAPRVAFACGASVTGPGRDELPAEVILPGA
jgi:hypothetical protein